MLRKLVTCAALVASMSAISVTARADDMHHMMRDHMMRERMMHHRMMMHHRHHMMRHGAMMHHDM